MRKSILFVLLISSTLLYACQFTVETPDLETTEPVAVESEPAPVEAQIEEVEEPTEPVVVETEAHPERFNTLNEYIALVRDSRTNDPYKTSEPSNIVKVMNLPMEGTDFGGYELWGNERWESKAEDVEQIFYIRSSFSQPYAEEPTITWFGPFKGNLGQLTHTYSKLGHFETIEGYMPFITQSKSNDYLKTTEPKNGVLIKDVTPEGADFVTYELWAREGWDLEDEEAIQTFFIKGIFSQPNEAEVEVTWFGPLNGKLGMLA